VEDSTSRENENQELGLSQKSISDGVHDGYEAEKELELLLADNIEQRMEEGLEGPGPIRVTGLFLSNENTIGLAIDLLALVLREASRDRR